MLGSPTARGTVLVTACLALAAPNASGGPQRRAEDAPYNYTSGLAAPGATSGHVTLGAAKLETFPRERKVSLEIVDMAGGELLGRAVQDVDGDGDFEVEHEFCGATETPVAIVGGADLTVFVMEGTCGDTPAVPTSGSVRALFRSR